MQEVVVRQRSAFKHLVEVERPGKEISWTFHTKKKNISFGVFRKTHTGTTTPNGVKTADAHEGPEGTLQRFRHASEGGFFGGRSSMASLPSSMQLDIQAGEREGSTRSGVDISPGSLSQGEDSPAGKKRGSKFTGERDLVEVVKVRHYESSKFQITGSFYVDEAGIYVLVFDNTFSVNTPKKLFFSVSVQDIGTQVSPTQQKTVEGWILKKGNRNFQGYAKRWMRIDPDGTLSYFKEPGSPLRGSVQLQSAAVRADHDHLLINVDSGNFLYHLKAQTKEEFSKWIAVIERYAEASSDVINESSIPDPNKRYSAVGLPAASGDLPVGDVDGSGFEFLRKKMDGEFAALLKELASIKAVAEAKIAADGPGTQEGSISAGAGRATDIASKLQKDVNTYALQLKQARDRLHGALYSTELAFQACVADNNRVRQLYGLEPVLLNQFLNPSIEWRTGSSASTAFSGGVILKHKQSTISARPRTIMSDNGSESVGTSIREGDEFYDAEDFVASEDEDVDVEEEGLVYSESAADLRRDGSQDDITSPERENQSSAGDGVSAKETIVDDAEIPTLVTSAAATANLPSSTAIVRRKVLPAGAASMASINILSILRNNVGKDLSTIPMPIVLNEPVNLLQKLAEELEYCSLIERASNTSNPVQRMAVVAAFAVSAYASMVYRTSKKPFNPLLGETYECWREDLGFKFISEKVSHRPPIMACHAEGPNFSFYQDSHVKTKFWGKSMEFIPSGTVHLVLPKFDEHYTWNKVTMCMRNLLAGTRYLEHYGTVKIESSNGYYCVLNFKEAGYFTSSKNEVTGSIFNKADKKQLSISGRWDDGIFQFKDETPNNLEVIWRANKLTLEQQEGYGFSSLAVELNELTPDLKGKLPPTDTRYRPDQRMYEQGIVNEAELEKQRLEQMQREKLKALEQEGIKWTPRWFKHVDGKGWLYSGGYWEHRGRFGDIADIFAAEEK